jgi:hypothetical protein
VIPTEQSPASTQRQLSRFVFLKGLNRMVEKGVADKVILCLVISADEYDRQSPAFLRSIPVCRSASALIRKIAGDIIPPPKMAVKSKLGFLRKIGQHGLDAYLDRLLLTVEIATAMKVVLVDDGPAIEPLRPQHEVDGLANRGFSDVIAADQKRVSCQVHDAMGNAPEIRDCQTLYFHLVQPPVKPV